MRGHDTERMRPVAEDEHRLEHLRCARREREWLLELIHFSGLDQHRCQRHSDQRRRRLRKLDDRDPIGGKLDRRCRFGHQVYVELRLPRRL